MPSIDPGPERRQALERVLALARLSLAVVLALVVGAGGATVEAPAILVTFVAAFAAYAALAAVLVAFAGIRVERLGAILHWIDVAWVLPITALTEGPNNVFLVFYLFTLVGAAYRWGLRQTAATGFITAMALVAEAAALQAGLHGVNGPDPWQIVTRSAYAIALGLLVGYLADDQHTTRTHLAASARVLSAVDTRAGLRASLSGVLGALVATVDARAAVLTVIEPESSVVHRWDLHGEDRALSLTREESAGWLPPQAGPAHVSSLKRVGSRVQVEDVRGLRSLASTAPAATLLSRDAQSALVGEGSFGDGWKGRLVLVDPAGGMDRRGRRWLATLLPQVGTALYNVYLLGRLRSRASAMERARLARELHDGVIQSLVGLEMHVDVLRRRLASADAASASELDAIQVRLHDEILNVRELMEEVRPVSGDGDDVPALLAAMADRFRRDSGIDARFLSTVDRVPLSPPRIRELVRIVQESLVNIRKHSGARTVVLRLGAEHDRCLLTVDDDGRGFEFAGRYTLDELDAARRGPLVIKERVRQLGGDLILESSPGHGSRLEISIPGGAA